MASILITGGTGFLGRALTKYLLQSSDYERICIYSRGEYAQAQMCAAIPDPDERLRWLIGDVRDRDRLAWAMRGVADVIHAAALKRIEVGRYNPSEMVCTNIGGTTNVIEAAMLAGTNKIVFISSDKACLPISPYGQSKALAESLILAANNIGGALGPKFAVCRYGNVAGSTGSVIPAWRELLRTTDTVPVSDPDCTRFWMRIDAAVKLIADTIQSMPTDPVIPSLPAYRLGDLAEAMGARMDIRGLPAWEKMHESMGPDNSSVQARRMSVDELREALQHV